MKGVNLNRIANLVFMDDLDFDRWDNAVNNPKYKNIVHGLRNALVYAVERKQLRGLMKKLFEEFLNELSKCEDKEEAEFLKKEIEKFLDRHKVEIL